MSPVLLLIVLVAALIGAHPGVAPARRRLAARWLVVAWILYSVGDLPRGPRSRSRPGFLLPILVLAYVAPFVAGPERLTRVLRGPGEPPRPVIDVTPRAAPRRAPEPPRRRRGRGPRRRPGTATRDRAARAPRRRRVRRGRRARRWTRCSAAARRRRAGRGACRGSSSRPDGRGAPATAGRPPPHGERAFAAAASRAGVTVEIGVAGDPHRGPMRPIPALVGAARRRRTSSTSRAATRT